MEASQVEIVKLRQVAGSTVVSIPRPLMDAAGLEVGERLFLTCTQTGEIRLGRTLPAQAQAQTQTQAQSQTQAQTQPEQGVQGE